MACPTNDTMSSQEISASMPPDTARCYFPSLIHTTPHSPERKRCIFWTPSYQYTRRNGLLPVPATYSEDVCKLAIALLLRTYIGTNSVSYGFLKRGYSDKNGRPIVTRAHMCKADLHESETVHESFSRLTSTPLNSSNGEGTDLDHRVFNTTLCLQPPGLHERYPEKSLDPIVENPWESDMFFCVANGIYGASSQNCIKFRLHYSTKLLDKTRARNVLSTFESIVSAITDNSTCPLNNLNIISRWDEYRFGNGMPEYRSPPKELLTSVWRGKIRTRKQSTRQTIFWV
ncbi:hypothetical protein K461DRAFT_277374 [Myriangium duriaei CBS 260.36]|uniref:Uncharacterized protein n=1 Tax=Myriangium duriaei CBS 260.36 TaxID=1168546 RepID=A0A9P4J471_9PEZI|nr:hypothetical protein K461DRAFT_277374 [Myriangium duriaei CBS 260.36]